MSAQELAVVQRALQITRGTQARFASLMRSMNWYPVPFFGSLASARFLTFGLNPSAGEFAPGRSWPDRMSAESLTERLVSYFSGRAATPHPWFRPWSDSLRTLGASYQRDSAHIDLSPRPTASARNFTKEPEKSLFIDMLRVDAPIWISALNAAPNVKMILLAGSATNKCYINQFIQTELGDHDVSLLPPWRPGGGEGQTAFQDFVLPGGRRIPAFFCSSGPKKPDVLVTAVSKNAERIQALAK